ncbi:hypothetical protein SAMD00019534_102590 [Acytostelium subglobosum LB1]|uniref:hypothetical protein n=1 Tax=Acytostelium subglobosum LB1 TaxID=1410327 RepID=UPI000644F134|nr:hypothetical protein SAMD00019534_102590 [Acytostelium subglobosum LB1]GAM27084.1 hypothetical protein SAMD00019534_102590 [Acytostelium subglobosum LB1]|eukprot:XP_012749964.1 hypothetical protein SAMD00019534_102590 [Acytostelium subglobosum LB1]
MSTGKKFFIPDDDDGFGDAFDEGKPKIDNTLIKPPTIDEIKEKEEKQKQDVERLLNQSTPQTTSSSSTTSTTSTTSTSRPTTSSTTSTSTTSTSSFFSSSRILKPKAAITSSPTSSTTLDDNNNDNNNNETVGYVQPKISLTPKQTTSLSLSTTTSLTTATTLGPRTLTLRPTLNGPQTLSLKLPTTGSLKPTLTLPTTPGQRITLSLPNLSFLNSNSNSSSGLSLATTAPTMVNRIVQVNEETMKITGIPGHFSSRLRWEYAKWIKPDVVIGTDSCCLYSSLKDYRLRPQHLETRARSLPSHFELRSLVVVIDIDDCVALLEELSCVSMQLDLVLFVAFNNAEAARYIESLKTFDNKTPDVIKTKQSSLDKTDIQDALTTIRGINKTDATTLVSAFGSVKRMFTSNKEAIGLCPGLGPKKVNSLYHVLHQPFKVEPKKQEELDFELPDRWSSPTLPSPIQQGDVSNNNNDDNDDEF